MKRFLVLLLFSPALLLSQTTPATGTATSIAVKWTPVPTTTGVTISGYTATVTSPASAVPISIPACAAATSANCIQPGQTTSGFTYAPGGALYYGQWTVVITTNGTNSAGTALKASATGTGTYALATPPVTVIPAVGGVTIQFTVPPPVAATTPQ